MMSKIKEMCVCAACGNAFVSKIGEHLCQKCCEEHETMEDRMELSRIISRRGFEWLTHYVEEYLNEQK